MSYFEFSSVSQFIWLVIRFLNPNIYKHVQSLFFSPLQFVFFSNSSVKGKVWACWGRHGGVYTEKRWGRG